MHGAHHAIVLVKPAAQKIAITVCRHPSGTREMAGVDAQRPVMLTVRVDAEYDLDGVFPSGGIRLGIEQSQINCEMCAVIFGQPVFGRRFIKETAAIHDCPCGGGVPTPPQHR